MPTNAIQDVKEIVREKYAGAALKVSSGGSCCGSSALPGASPITSNLYDEAQAQGLPAEAMLASLGCGLDMTDEMLALARDNQRKAGLDNIEFLKGEIEAIPLPDASVDVIISNCVINLSADKDRVLRDAFRVLKPGGRFAVSDVVTRGTIPEALRSDILLWVGCLAGALDEQDSAAKLSAVGFEAVSIEPTRVYKVDDAREFLTGKGVDVDAIAPLVDGKFFSGFVRATKPSTRAETPARCCG